MGYRIMEFEDISLKIRNSPFNRIRYRVTIQLKRAINSIMNYTHMDGSDIDMERIFEAIPKFQRDNDKWTTKMQQGFIENIIMGFKTDILLFEVGDKGYIDCMILDGLQRITAIYKFLNNDLLVFGKTLDELMDGGILRGFNDGYINLNIFTFDTEAEAVQYYIDINENITHSNDDIIRAKNYLYEITHE